MRERNRFEELNPAFRLAIATSWLAPDSWRQNQENTIREAVAAAPDWHQYFALVRRHHTPALSWSALSRVPGISIPEPLKQQLQALSESCRITAIRHSLVLAEVLKELDRAAIPAMPLKGPVLSFELYGDLGLRQSEDLDLQVPKDDLRRAMVCLESMGWSCGSDSRGMSPRQWESFLRNDYEVQFTHSRMNCSLELHWRNHWETADATSARWARTTPTVWQGRATRRMSAGDLGLFLCVHGAYHVWCCAKWLSDVARAHSIGRLDWSAAMEEARTAGLEGVCTAAQVFLRDLYGLEVPDPANFASERTGVRRLPLLIKMPLESLQLSQDPRGRMGVDLLRNHMRMMRYERLVRPRKAWKESLAELFYCELDFRMLPLPDSLFWAYKPLRPILWMWRWAAQAWRQALEQSHLRVSP